MDEQAVYAGSQGNSLWCAAKMPAPNASPETLITVGDINDRDQAVRIRKARQHRVSSV